VQIETGIDQRLRLTADGFDQRRRAVAKAVGATGLGKVEVRAVVAVPQPRTLTPDEHLLRPFDAGHQALGAQIFAVVSLDWPRKRGHQDSASGAAN
jgi:hypothetical protein